MRLHIRWSWPRLPRAGTIIVGVLVYLVSCALVYAWIVGMMLL